MKDIDEIRARIRKIEEDSRYQDDPADVFINAPLALIQVEMDTTVRVLKWVLEEDGEEASRG